MADLFFINELIQSVVSGKIRIPSFQRGFVWDADRVAHLMDSIYKGFPFGSLLLWRTKHPLRTERQLGPFQLPSNDPDYPVDYVLDGQQRVTSIFGVFQCQLTATPGEDDSIFKIYFDLSQDPSLQDSNFIFVPDSEFDSAKHFPLRLLFNPPEYRKFLKAMKDDVAEKVDQLYQRFTTARIPVQTFSTDDRTAVAIVFERINRMGVELDTFQLMAAWSWSDDFDLQSEFQSLGEDLQPFGFQDVGKDSDLLLKCCSAIIMNDASPNAIMNLKGEDVRKRFTEIRKGINGAIDFLRTSLKVYSAKVLPFDRLLIPLSVFYSTSSEHDTNPSADQHEKLLSWAWRVFFSRRYSKRLEQMNHDIQEIAKMKASQPNTLGDFTIDLDSDFFLGTSFNMNTANTKTLILMLAAEGPLNFISGAEIALDPVLRDCNKKEFHHVFPKAFLAKGKVANSKINCLSNFVMLSKADNSSLGGVAPSKYRTKMPSNSEQMRLILKKALCPDDIFHDNFERFLSERTALLLVKAKTLMKLN